MQLQLTPNELQILNDALSRQNRELMHDIARTDRREYKLMLQKKLEILVRLQGQLIHGRYEPSAEQHDLLAEVLDERERSLYFEIARTDDRQFKHLLRKNLEWLESAHGKIEGASAAA